jgi:phosphoglycerate dehydrogenase-like enzyme
MTPQRRVLVTARAFWDSGHDARAALAAAGFEVVNSAAAGPIASDQLAGWLADFDAIIGSTDEYNAALIQACPRLKVIARCGVGLDSVDMAAATAAGVIVTNTPGAMTEAVADYAFALMLALARRIVEGDVLMRRGGWAEFPGVLLPGKTLGLVGCGQIGQAMARRAAGFGMRILAYDPQLAQRGAPHGLPAISFVSLEELLAQSDFVSVHAPSIPETRHMFDAKRFAQMKRTAYFINTARGALVDESALVEALTSGRIAGAATDVYEREPLPSDHPLRKAPRCVLTPHNAFNAVEAAKAMSDVSAASILDLFAGRKPGTVCNPDVWKSPDLRLKGSIGHV